MMAKLTKVTRHGQITLPSDIRKELHIEVGDLIEVSVADGHVVLVPKKLVDSSQAWFWGQAWQAGEREAEEDLRAGRTTRFDSTEDLIADLDSAEEE